jgi:hypothetical protein
VRQSGAEPITQLYAGTHLYISSWIVNFTNISFFNVIDLDATAYLVQTVSGLIVSLSTSYRPSTAFDTSFPRSDNFNISSSAGSHSLACQQLCTSTCCVQQEHGNAKDTTMFSWSHQKNTSHLTHPTMHSASLVSGVS